MNSIIATVGSVPTEGGPHTLTVNDFDAATGRMTWWGAMAWAAQLDFGGSTQWRLPSHPCTSWASGCTVYGVNQPGSEMGHLFYTELGGVAFQAISATHNANYDLFTNVQDWKYASGQEGTFPFNPAGAYVTSFSNGDQYATFQYIGDLHAWAVHDGDIGSVTAVPEPGTLALLAAGLAAVTTTARRRRQT